MHITGSLMNIKSIITKERKQKTTHALIDHVSPFWPLIGGFADVEVAFISAAAWCRVGKIMHVLGNQGRQVC